MMKKISILLSMFFALLLFNSCEKEKEPTIYVKYNWTASLQYYSDNIPVTYGPGEENARQDQGPVPSGTYTYRYKLSFENTERSGTNACPSSTTARWSEQAEIFYWYL